MSRKMTMRSLHAAVLGALGAGLLAAGGCGEGAPLPLGQVRGTIKYEDGSLIEADQIRIVFQPQNVAAKGKIAPRAAEVYANVSDGSFGELTTWKPGDGVLVGRHKVTAIALRLNQQGMSDPTRAIPSRYHRADTTPLEVEVVDGGENEFTLKIPKGS